MSRKFFAFENDESVVEGTGSDETLPETTAAAQEAHEEITSAAANVDEVIEATQEGVDASTELTQHADNVAAQIDKGEGLSEDAAKATEIAIESIRNRLGLPKRVGRMPSMESFKSPRSRVEATKVALEAGIVDTLKAIWKRITEFASMVVDKVKNIVASLTKNYEKLEEQIKALKERASNAKGEKDKSTIDSAKLAGAFSIDGRANVGTLEQTLAKVSKLVDEAPALLTHTEKTARDYGNERSIEQAKETLNFYVGEFTRIFGAPDPTTKDQVTTNKYKDFPGGKTLVVEVTSKKESVSIGISLEAGKTVASSFDAVESGSQVSGILDKLLVEAKKGNKIKADLAKSESAAKAISKSATDHSKALDKIASNDKDSGINREKLRLSADTVNSALKVVTFVSSRIPAVHFDTVYRGVQLSQALLSNLKDKK